MVSKMNVPIDDSDEAVLCDFGLSRIKIGINTRMKKGEESFVTGMSKFFARYTSRRHPKSTACDIYTFGMTAFEVSLFLLLACEPSCLLGLIQIYVGETPLAEIPYVNFYTLIIKQGMRPERPEV
jgi:serine/threonine protein kinase